MSPRIAVITLTVAVAVEGREDSHHTHPWRKSSQVRVARERREEDRQDTREHSRQEATKPDRPGLLRSWEVKCGTSECVW